MKRPTTTERKHPNQPIGFDSTGVARFKANAIVNHLVDHYPDGLNALAMHFMDTHPEDYTQLMQLIGYSVSGFGGLDSSPPETVAAADAIVRAMCEHQRAREFEQGKAESLAAMDPVTRDAVDEALRAAFGTPPECSPGHACLDDALGCHRCNCAPR
jgi:hypothetical protein